MECCGTRTRRLGRRVRELCAHAVDRVGRQASRAPERVVVKLLFQPDECDTLPGTWRVGGPRYETVRSVAERATDLTVEFALSDSDVVATGALLRGCVTALKDSGFPGRVDVSAVAYEDGRTVGFATSVSVASLEVPDATVAADRTPLELAAAAFGSTPIRRVYTTDDDGRWSIPAVR